jgi:hypothetical protein
MVPKRIFIEATMRSTSTGRPARAFHDDSRRLLPGEAYHNLEQA